MRSQPPQNPLQSDGWWRFLLSPGLWSRELPDGWSMMASFPQVLKDASTHLQHALGWGSSVPKAAWTLCLKGGAAEVSVTGILGMVQGDHKPSSRPSPGRWAGPGGRQGPAALAGRALRRSRQDPLVLANTDTKFLRPAQVKSRNT